VNARTTDKEAKRKAILEACLKIIARNGIHGFKMIDVATAAGIGKGTIYEYFPSKSELVLGVFAEFMDSFGAMLSLELAKATEPAERVRCYIRSFIEYCGGQSFALEAIFDFYAAGVPRKNATALFQGFAPMYRDMIDDLAGTIAQGIEIGQFREVDPQFEAAAILAALDGYMFQVALGVSKIEPSITAEKMCLSLMGGLLNSGNNKSVSG